MGSWQNLRTAVIMVLGCRFFRTDGEYPHNVGKPDGVPPGNPQNPLLPTPDKTSKSDMGFLKK